MQTKRSYWRPPRPEPPTIKPRRSWSTARPEFEQFLQAAELEGDQVPLDHERGVLEPFACLELAFGVDDFGASLASASARRAIARCMPDGTRCPSPRRSRP